MLTARQVDVERLKDPHRGLELALRLVSEASWKGRTSRGRAYGALGSAYRALGDLDRAEASLFAAGQLLPHVGTDGAELAIRWAYLKRDRRDLEAALSLARFAVGQLKRFGAPLLELAKARIDLGSILMLVPDYGAAAQESRAGLEVVDYASDPYYISAIGNLATALAYSESLTSLERAELRSCLAELGMRWNSAGPAGRLRIRWVRALADHRFGRSDSAESELLRIRRQLASGPALDYAAVALDLALLYSEQGRHKDVAQIAGEAFGALRAVGEKRDARAALLLFCQAASAGAVEKRVILEVQARLRRSGLIRTVRPTASQSSG